MSLYFRLNDVWLAEVYAYISIPESLQSSGRGLVMEESLGKMEKWLASIDEIIKAIGEMVEG